MANEISYGGALYLNQSNSSNSVPKVSREVTVGSITPSQTTPAYVANTATVTTSAAALALGAVASCGFAMFKNLGPTNYVEIGVDSGGFVPFLKLLVGESSGPIRLGTNAPQAKANTASISLEYLILSA